MFVRLMRPRPFGFAQDRLHVALHRIKFFFWKSDSDNGMVLGVDCLRELFLGESQIPLTLILSPKGRGKQGTDDAGYGLFDRKGKERRGAIPTRQALRPTIGPVGTALFGSLFREYAFSCVNATKCQSKGAHIRFYQTNPIFWKGILMQNPPQKGVVRKNYRKMNWVRFGKRTQF
jgi:hypothetical protein